MYSIACPCAVSDVLLFHRSFSSSVNVKGSSGTIEFDHENRELGLVVQKDSADEQSQQKDVKALSGGEKSFT